MTFLISTSQSQQLIGVCDSTLIDEACSIIEEFRITQIIPDAVSKNQNLDVGFKSPVRQIAQLKERSRSLDGSYLSACKSNEYDFEKLSLNTRVYLETNIKVINNKNVDSIRPSASPNSLRKRANRMTRHGSLKDDKRNKSDVLLSLSDKRLDVFPYYKSEKVSVRNGNSSSESYDLSTSDLVMYNNVKNEGDNSCIGLECTKDVSNNLSRTWEEPEPWVRIILFVNSVSKYFVVVSVSIPI